MASAKLYDKDFIDCLPPFLSRGPNAGVVALCRREQPAFAQLRAAVERWFRRLDAETQRSLRPRLRCFGEAIFTSSLFEITLAGYFQSRGWRFDYEPVMQGKTPDFAVEVDGTDYIFEVATVYDTNALTREFKRVNQLETWLNERIESEYWIMVHYRKWPPADVDKQEIKSKIEELIEATTDDLATYRLKEPISAGIILARASGGRRKGRVGASGTPVISGSIKSKLSETLDEKAKKYAKLGLPLVLVACDPGNFWDLEDFDVQQAVYGTESFRVFPDGSPTPVRQRDGLFSKNDPDGLPRRRYVSGVLVMLRSYTGGEVWFPMRFYANPYAETPVPESTFTGVPRLFPEADGSAGIRNVWHDKDAPPLPLW